MVPGRQPLSLSNVCRHRCRGVHPLQNDCGHGAAFAGHGPTYRAVLVHLQLLHSGWHIERSQSCTTSCTSCWLQLSFQQLLCSLNLPPRMITIADLSCRFRLCVMSQSDRVMVSCDRPRIYLVRFSNRSWARVRSLSSPDSATKRQCTRFAGKLRTSPDYFFVPIGPACTHQDTQQKSGQPKPLRQSNSGLSRPKSRIDDFSCTKKNSCTVPPGTVG